MSATFQVEWHRAIVDGKGPYPDQYRILTYWLAEGLIRLGLPFQLAHESLRFVFTASTLYCFARYLLHWFEPIAVVLGVLCLAWGLPLTCAYEAMQPTDPLNLLAFALALWAFVAKRDWWLVPIVALGTLNRETALLLLPLYVLVRLRGGSWLPVAVVASTLGVLAYLAPRIYFGPRPPYAETLPLRILRTNVEDWATWALVFAFFHIGLLSLWPGWKAAPAFLRRVAWLAPALLVVYAGFGYIREIRLLLPALLVTIPLLLCVLNPPSRVEIERGTKSHAL